MALKTSHIHVEGGIFDDESKLSTEKVLANHNFVNKLDILIRNSDLRKIENSLPKFCQKIVFDASLSSILVLILQLKDINDRKGLKVITLDEDISHENSFSISGGHLTLKLRSDVYHKSGFSFKLSKFSKGNKNFRTQMYIHTFDILKLEQSVKANSKNEVRLFWFAEHIFRNKLRFIIASESSSANEIVELLRASKIDILKNTNIVPQITALGKCNAPCLEIANDEASLTDALEWLSYTISNGIQVKVHRKTNPYISRYPLSLEIEAELDLVRISLSKSLISSSMQIELFKLLYEAEVSWFSFISSGIKDSIITYSNKGEHSYIDDGINDLVIFVNNGKYIQYKITDSGDSN